MLKPSPENTVELPSEDRLRAELFEAQLAFKRIEQDPRTPPKMRDIAGARGFYIRQLLGCRKHGGATFIVPDVCPFCEANARSSKSTVEKDNG